MKTPRYTYNFCNCNYVIHSAVAENLTQAMDSLKKHVQGDNPAVYTWTVEREAHMMAFIKVEAVRGVIARYGVTWKELV